MRYKLRLATSNDSSAVAEIWRVGWADGHLGHVDQRLVDARTSTSFLERTQRRLTHTALATMVAVDLDDDRVAGFVMTADDEVEQIYVEADHRRTGCAALLMGAAESQIAAAGFSMAWLAVVNGNARARQFYTKLGWSDRGPSTYTAAAGDGTGDPIPVEAHRYEKSVALN